MSFPVLSLGKPNLVRLFSFCLAWGASALINCQVQLHAPIKCNHAQTGGTVRAIGYRALMEAGYDLGIYAMYSRIPAAKLDLHFGNAV